MPILVLTIMSNNGRGFLGFETGHRPDEVERLAKRFSHGVKTNKIPHADYEKLETMLLEKKMAANQSALKFKKMKQASRQNRGSGLLHQHRAIWKDASRRMAEERGRTERDLRAFLKIACDQDSDSKIIFDSMDRGIAALGEELKVFRDEIVSPLWLLRDEAKSWSKRTAALDARGVEEMKPERLGTLKEEDEEEEITEEEKLSSLFSSSSKRISEIYDVLKNEEDSLTRQLQRLTDDLKEVFDTEEIRERDILVGYPLELDQWSCPAEELRIDAREEFRYIDEIFMSKLREHDSYYGDFRKAATEWSDSDHVTFLLLLDQYPSGVAENNAVLLADRLAKTFPGKTRMEIVNHQSRCRKMAQYADKKESIFNDWKRHRNELLEQVKLVFDEAVQLTELEKVAEEGRQLQDRKCQALMEQVQEWREKKMEAWHLQQQLSEEMRKQREEAAKKDEEKRKKKAEENKQKINAFHQEKQKECSEWIKDTQKRLRELESELTAQAEVNAHRVEFRARMLEEKKAAARRREEEEAEERRRREAALDALRATVSVEAEVDLTRLYGDTAATRERYGKNPQTWVKDDDYEKASATLHCHLSGPRLFYTDAQILSDKRVRAEMLLRDAGVQFGDYTRNMIRGIKPPQEPRRDQLRSDIDKS